MAKKITKNHFLMCIKNEGYEVSLDVRKIYRKIPDARAAEKGFVRVVDESGDDYLFPSANFVPVELSSEARHAFLTVAS